MITPANTAVTIERTFQAPAELVFRAFTEAALLEQWFCPAPEVAMRVEQLDMRPGGAYRFVYYFPGGVVRPVVGEYIEISPPNRLVFTWTWKEPDPWAGIVTQVTIDFREANGVTDVRVHHERMLGEGEMAPSHQRGWTATLARLEPLLGSLSH